MIKVVDQDIYLESLDHQHVALIFDLINREREFLSIWLPFVDHTLEQAQTEEYLQFLEVSETKDMVFAIYYRNQFVGIAGLKDPDYDNHRIELGYWISEHFQGKGIVTRCCKTLIQFAFEELNMNRIQIKVATGNIRSQRIPERLSFLREGTEREGELLKSGFVDLIVYSLLKNDPVDWR